MEKIIVSAFALSAFSTAHAGMLVDRESNTAMVVEIVDGGVGVILCTGIKSADQENPSAVLNNSACAPVHDKPLNEKLFAKSAKFLKKRLAALKSEIAKENEALFRKAEESLIASNAETKRFNDNPIDLANAVQALQIDEELMLKKRLLLLDYSSPFQYSRALAQFAESRQVEDSTIVRMVNLANVLAVVAR